MIKYYELFNNLINEIQQSAFRIADKTAQRDSISTLGNNIRKISEKLLDYFALNFFSYRNIGMQQPPIELAAYFSNLAHVFYTAIRLIEPKEREEMLRYFYEWRDITPGNFEELLARNIDLLYDHQDIFSTMAPVQELLKIMAALWNKLSTLEFIGQRRENIVVAEQQMVQQVQVKRSWTLLD